MNNEVLNRVIEEKKQLQEKLSKLCAFIGTDKFLALAPANRIMLEQQCDVMKRYRDILDVRIELMS